jgi:hypothetical protein
MNRRFALAANLSRQVGEFFPNSASLNGSESGGGLSPLGSSPLPDPAIPTITQAGERKERFMNPMLQCKPTILPLLIALVLVCFGLLPQGQATPDPGSVNPFNTADGDHALFSNTIGFGNSAFGWYALFANTDGSFNTAVGAGALDLNNGNSNTAVGTAALLLNTGSDNTAVGTAALENNTVDGGNTAVGSFALFVNIAGSTSTEGPNTAVGFDALVGNTTGSGNVAVGATNIGAGVLGANTTGSANTAIGQHSLIANVDGIWNTVVGAASLFTNISGNFNTAVGVQAGFNITGSGNIDIGQGVVGVAGESNTIRIGDNLNGTGLCFVGGITGVTGANFTDLVLLDPLTGQLGDLPSSERFKRDIDPMDKTSEAIFSLRPVTFHYKNDQTNTPQFGLIAEEVAKVNPVLVAVDKEGKPYSVQYLKINAMLLNEFLKEHRKVEQLQKQVEALTAGLQKVSAQLELNRREPETVSNNH